MYTNVWIYTCMLCGPGGGSDLEDGQKIPALCPRGRGERQTQTLLYFASVWKRITLYQTKGIASGRHRASSTSDLANAYHEIGAHNLRAMPSKRRGIAHSIVLGKQRLSTQADCRTHPGGLSKQSHARSCKHAWGLVRCHHLPISAMRALIVTIPLWIGTCPQLPLVGLTILHRTLICPAGAVARIVPRSRRRRPRSVERRMRRKRRLEPHAGTLDLTLSVDVPGTAHIVTETNAGPKSENDVSAMRPPMQQRISQHAGDGKDIRHKHRTHDSIAITIKSEH